MNKRLSAIFALLVLSVALFAATTSHVEKDENGWRMFVNGEPFPVYGMVWSYTPIGETHSYNLWSKPDSFVKAMIDRDMPLLKQMGVNTIRCFDDIPAKWVEYIYHEYGITTMINNLLGRYGVTVDGIWNESTDYSDRKTQETLIESARKSARTYKDVDGVVMYMLGNESNYGLVWKGSEIEDLPAENQDEVKAGYLYDLLEKAMAAVKEEDPNRVVGFINGETLNMNIISQLCPSLDVFGVNSYRGYSYGDSFFDAVQDGLDKPVVITESGADAYNALLGQEDQYMQAHYFYGQWKDLYEHAYGKGKAANIVGAFVFEWVDEWWKNYQYKDLDVHNAHGSWANAGYDMDYRPGVNNMDEEWFGIMAQGTDEDFIARRIPRAAYYLLSDIFKLDIYSSTKDEVEALFSGLDLNAYYVRGYAASIRNDVQKEGMFSVSNGSVQLDIYAPIPLNGSVSGNYDTQAKARLESSLTFSFKPFERLTASVTAKAWTNNPYGQFESTPAVYDGKNHFMLYNGAISYSGDMVDVNGYYHAPMAGFSDAGDIFSLVPDSYDITSYDKDGVSAPIAAEVVGKGAVDGLRVVGGTEIYSGAKPLVVAGYDHYFPSTALSAPAFYVSGIAIAEYQKPVTGSTDSGKRYGGGYKASMMGAMYLEPWVNLELGGLISGTEKIDATYTTATGDTAKITFMDTIGASAKLSTNMFSRFNVHAQAIYRGLVADTNAQSATSVLIGSDTGAGNRLEILGGIDFTYGANLVQALYRYRTPLQGPTVGGRDVTTGSPFAVTSNRQAQEIELAYTYDPEGVSSFYAWNNKDQEEAAIAGSISALYTLEQGPTDKITYKDQNGIYIAVAGFPAAKNLFQVKGRMILNVLPGLRFALNAGYGRIQVNNYGTSRIISPLSVGLDIRYGNLLLLTSFEMDSLGPETWQQNMGHTYPYQWSADLRYGFKTPSFLNADNSIGLKWRGQTYGSYSTAYNNAFDSDGAMVGSSLSELTLYYRLSW